MFFKEFCLKIVTKKTFENEVTLENSLAYTLFEYQIEAKHSRIKHFQLKEVTLLFLRVILLIRKQETFRLIICTCTMTRQQSPLIIFIRFEGKIFLLCSRAQPKFSSVLE